MGVRPTTNSGVSEPNSPRRRRARLDGRAYLQWLDEFSDKPFRKTNLMLGTAHILMIRHGFYRSLPHRRGEGGTGTLADQKQELRRQLRVVRRNPNLIATLFLHQAGLQQGGDEQ